MTGNYSQMTSFIKGLDSFPRLFIIQTFNLTYGNQTPTVSGAAATSSPSAPVGPVVGIAVNSSVGGWNSHYPVARSLQPGHPRIDLLHDDTQRIDRLHQGHYIADRRPEHLRTQ